VRGRGAAAGLVFGAGAAGDRATPASTAAATAAGPAAGAATAGLAAAALAAAAAAAAARAGELRRRLGAQLEANLCAARSGARGGDCLVADLNHFRTVVRRLRAPNHHHRAHDLGTAFKATQSEEITNVGIAAAAAVVPAHNEAAVTLVAALGDVPEYPSDLGPASRVPAAQFVAAARAAAGQGHAWLWEAVQRSRGYGDGGGNDGSGVGEVNMGSGEAAPVWEAARVQLEAQAQTVAEAERAAESSSANGFRAPLEKATWSPRLCGQARAVACVESAAFAHAVACVESAGDQYASAMRYIAAARSRNATDWADSSEEEEDEEKNSCSSNSSSSSSSRQSSNPSNDSKDGDESSEWETEDEEADAGEVTSWTIDQDIFEEAAAKNRAKKPKLSEEVGDTARVLEYEEVAEYVKADKLYASSAAKEDAEESLEQVRAPSVGEAAETQRYAEEERWRVNEECGELEAHLRKALAACRRILADYHRGRI
jgi:hypothetical protein